MSTISQDIETSIRLLTERAEQANGLAKMLRQLLVVQSAQARWDVSFRFNNGTLQLLDKDLLQRVMMNGVKVTIEQIEAALEVTLSTNEILIKEQMQAMRECGDAAAAKYIGGEG